MLGVPDEEEESGECPLKDAAAHLESAARCIETAAPLEGNLDLVARTHITSAAALVEMLRKHHDESSGDEKKARAAAGGAGM